MKRSALSWVRSGENDVLVVYNERFGGYGLPGGMFDEALDDDLEDTQRRELLEETGANTKKATLFYSAPHNIKALERPRERESMVYVYRVEIEGEPASQEGTEVRWMDTLEFVSRSPFRPFYEDMKARLIETERSLMLIGDGILGKKLITFWLGHEVGAPPLNGLRYEGEDLQISVVPYHHDAAQMIASVTMTGLKSIVVVAPVGDWDHVRRELRSAAALMSEQAGQLLRLLDLSESR